MTALPPCGHVGCSPTVCNVPVTVNVNPERGSIFTGVKGGRIVGPEAQALKLSDSLNDLELHYAFLPDVDTQGARIYSRAMMAEIGVKFPVLVMPESARASFADDLPPELSHLQPYDGPLPAARTMTSFGIVTPGSRS